MRIDKLAVDKVKKALRFSTAEGVAYGTMQGFGDNYIVAYAVALQTNSLQIGILCSLPGLLASLAQLWDTELVRLLKSRKAVILVFALLQGLMFLPILGLVFLPEANIGWWLIVLATVYSVSGSLISPAWGSIMAEVVPAQLRGKYFSLRGSLSTLAATVSFLTGGIFINFLAQKALWGFAFLFGAAFLARIISWALLTRLYEMPTQKKPVEQTKTGDFARTVISTNLGKYMLFLFSMGFAVNIASPYFTVYQLRDLKLSYFAFASLGTASSVATLVTITGWGRAADRVGNLKMMFLASALIPLVPLLWLVSTNLTYLGFVQAFSGFAWAGFNLCSINYLYDATTPENRTRYLAYFNFGNGLASGLGALLGGYLVPHMPPFLGYQILSVFLLSGVLRGAVSFAFLPGIKEVRRISTVPAAELFHIAIGGRPINRRMSNRQFSHFHHHDPPAQEPVKPSPGQD